MAFTITQSPGTNILSANNPAIFVVSSSNATQTDHKYRADLYLSGSFLTTLKDFPHPQLKFGTFDLSDITANLVNYDFFPSGSGFFNCSSSTFDITVKFGEQYITGSDFSQSLNLVSSSNLHFINSALSFRDQFTGSMNDYYLDGSSTKKCLTKKSDKTFLAYNNLKQWLYYYSTSGSVPNVSIFTYHNGENIGTYTITNPFASENGMQAFASGMAQLSTLSTSSYSVVSGNYPIITSQVTNYIVNLGGDGGETIPDLFITDLSDFFVQNNLDFLDTGYSETVPDPNSGIAYQFNVTSNCGKFAPGSISLYWLNTLGGFDSFLFNKSNQTTSTKTQSQYKKVLGRLNNNGTYTIDSYSPSQVNFYTETKDSIELNTDWLDDSTILWLKELFDSPVVYMEDSTGFICAVNVKDDSYPISKKVNQKLFQLKLTIEPSFTDYRQRM